MTKEEQEKLGELAMKFTNEKSIEIFGATDPSLGNSDYRMGWERGCELGFRKGYCEALNIAGKNLVKADVIKSVCDHPPRNRHYYNDEMYKCCKCEKIIKQAVENG